VFLPTTTFLEEEDALVSWGHNILGGVNPAIDPVGESRSDLWIVQQLADRLGIGEEMAGTPREWLRRVMSPMEAKGVTVDALLDGPIRCPVAPLIPFADKKFPTRSGHFEFITEIEVEQRRDPAFPLTLVTNFSKKWLLSQMTEAEHPKLATVRVGADWAASHGIENGRQMRLRSAVGELVVEVQVDPRVGKEMVIMAVGTWMKRGGGVNILTEDIMTNFGEMAAYGETRVLLEPLEPAPAAATRGLDLQMTS
jgi:anaerobic selenocysteine-containing dehydrogenase